MLRRAYTGLERTLGPTARHHTQLPPRSGPDSCCAGQRCRSRSGGSRDSEDHRQIARSRAANLAATLLGAVLDKQGKHKEAEVQIRQALRLNEKANGADHGFTLASRATLARNLWYQGRNAEAETLLRELIRAHEKKLGAQVYLLENNVSSRVDEIDTLTPLESRTLFANTLRDQGKYAEAEAQYKEVIQLEENVLGPEHRDTLNACYNLAYQLGQQGKRDRGKGVGRAGRERCGESFGRERSLYPRIRKIPGRTGKRPCDHDACSRVPQDFCVWKQCCRTRSALILLAAA